MTCEPNPIQDSGDGSSHERPIVTCTEMVGEGETELTQPLLSRKKQSVQPYKGKVVPCCICLQRELRNEIKHLVREG